MSKHSDIGPSSAERWLNCPGSVALSKQAPAEEPSVHAARGTAAHHVLEMCFDTEEDYWNYEGFEYPGGELNEADIEAVEEDIEWLDDEKEDLNVSKEIKIDLSVIDEELFGTADIVMAAGDKSILKVYDYKHGTSKVDLGEEDNRNPQLMTYALGAIQALAPDLVSIFGWGSVYKEVWIGIMQPRHDHPEGTCRKVLVTAEELNDFANDLKVGANATRKPNAELTTGKWCKWCRGKALCPKQYADIVAVAQTDFKAAPALTLPEVTSLSPSDIGKVLTYEPMITAWLKSMKTYAQHVLDKGGEVEGFKLVKKRAYRSWTNPEEAAKLLQKNGVDPYEKKLLSPAKAEKELEDKKLLDGLIVQPDNGNTIAPVYDRRKEVTPSSTDDFTSIKGE